MKSGERERRTNFMLTPPVAFHTTTGGSRVVEERIIFRMRRSLLFSFHHVQEVMHRHRQSAKELSPVSCDLFNKPLFSCKGPEYVIPFGSLVRDESRLRVSS